MRRAECGRRDFPLHRHTASPTSSSHLPFVSRKQAMIAPATDGRELAKPVGICQRSGPSLPPCGDSMPPSTARTLKGPRRFVRRAAHRAESPRWQFLRGFLKHPVMVGSIIPSSKLLIDRMLDPVDWDRTKLFVEYGPGVGTFTRPILERLGPDATLIAIDTNPDFVKYLKQD